MGEAEKRGAALVGLFNAAVITIAAVAAYRHGFSPSQVAGTTALVGGVLEALAIGQYSEPQLGPYDDHADHGAVKASLATAALGATTLVVA